MKESSAVLTDRLDTIDLRYELSKAHDAITAMASRRFRFYLCRLATSQSLPLDPGAVNTLCVRFEEEASCLGRSVNVEKKLAICHNVFTNAANLKEAARLAAMNMDTASQCFCMMLKKAFARHAGKFMNSHPGNTFDPEALKHSSRVYTEDVSQRASRHFHKITEILVTFHGQRALPAAETVSGEKTPLSGGTPLKPAQPSPYRISDPFGRGLLNPLGAICRIASHNEPLPCGIIRFPREYCSPVLNVVTTLVFGKEKYDRISKKFLRSMISFCGSDRPESEILTAFYRDEGVVQFLARFVLYILMGLDSETRRMFFIRKVNMLLSAAPGTIVEPFSESHMVLLLESWTTYATLHQDCLPKKIVDRLARPFMACAI